MKIDDIRRSYVKDKLDMDKLNLDPFAQFELWLKDAIAAELPDPTAMCVATVDEHGQPSQRLVLLKDVNADGFVFYTNLGSRKARELAGNPKVCLHFPWHPLERQVIVYGLSLIHICIHSPQNVDLHRRYSSLAPGRNDFIPVIDLDWLNFKQACMLESFFRQLSTEPETISFQQTIALIDALYEFTPTAFSNGQISNAAGENNGSCKILAFALLHQLSEPQTLALFGDYYRLEVLPDIKGTNHANIRNFMRTGWDGVSFSAEALHGKSE